MSKEKTRKPANHLDPSRSARLHPGWDEIVSNIRDEISALSSLIECATLDSSRIAEYETMIFSAKEKYIKEIYKPKEKFYIIENRKRKNGSDYCLYKARPVGESNYLSSPTYEGLIEKLYAHYAKDNEPQTLAEIFEPATLWKAGRNTSGKTLYEYKRVWNKYIKDNSLADCKLRRIDCARLEEFYEEICVQHGMTWKQVCSVRDVLSYLMSYCVKHRLIPFNPTRDVDYKDLPVVKTASNKGKICKTPFTPKQTEEVVRWCDNELAKPRVNKLHPLGIKFVIEMGDRYGELRGLRWQDIDFREKTITVCDQSVPQYEMNSDLSFNYNGRVLAGHIKGYEDPVTLPLSDQALKVLEQIRSLDLDDEYVFPAEHFRYNTFNDKVKAAAGAIGLKKEKYSTHSLRATAATNLYLKTHDIYQVQLLLHHTTPEMTMKYIKDLDISEKLRQSMSTSLSTEAKSTTDRQKEVVSNNLVVVTSSDQD